MLDVPHRLVDQVGDVGVMQGVDDRAAATRADDETEVAQQPQLMGDGGAFHLDSVGELVDAARSLTQPREYANATRCGERLHRVCDLASGGRIDRRAAIVPFDSVCHRFKIAEQMLICSAL